MYYFFKTSHFLERLFKKKNFFYRYKQTKASLLGVPIFNFLSTQILIFASKRKIFCKNAHKKFFFRFFQSKPVKIVSQPQDAATIKKSAQISQQVETYGSFYATPYFWNERALLDFFYTFFDKFFFQTPTTDVSTMFKNFLYPCLSNTSSVRGPQKKISPNLGSFLGASGTQCNMKNKFLHILIADIDIVSLIPLLAKFVS